MQKKQQLVSERKRQTQRRGGGGGVSEKRDAMLSPFPSFLNTAQSSGSGEQSERCGTYPYSKSPDGADLNQPPAPHTPRYKYSGKPADTGNNKQRHMLRSTSVGRRLSSCRRASHFSSEFIHEGAPFGARHNTGKPELAEGGEGACQAASRPCLGACSAVEKQVAPVRKHNVRR